jgi:hypothetical protein
VPQLMHEPAAAAERDLDSEMKVQGEPARARGAEFDLARFQKG